MQCPDMQRTVGMVQELVRFWWLVCIYAMNQGSHYQVKRTGLA